MKKTQTPARRPQRRKSKKLKQAITPWRKRTTAQDSLPYEELYPDGLCFLGDGKYSATFSFTDINYSNTSETARVGVFEKYCYFLNAFDDTVRLQLHIVNRALERTQQNLKLEVPEDGVPALAGCVREYNGQLQKRISGSHSYIQEKYITLTITDDSYESARKRMERIEADTLSLLRSMGCATRMLNEVQRAYLLREIYRPDDQSAINYRQMARTGIYGKDLIAPYSIDVSNEYYLRMGGYCYQTLFLTDFPQDLTDDLIRDISSVDADLFLTVNILPQDPRLAIEQTRKRLNRLDKQKYDSFSRQTSHGVLVPEVPRSLQRALDNASAFLTDLESRNEKMFLSNILLLARAKTPEEIDLLVDDISRKINKSGCTLQPFAFDSENAFHSVLPLGRNDTFVKRTFTTTSMAVFHPFHVVEIVQEGGFSYGKNRLSNNLLCLDRRTLLNPHGFYFGCSGSGKSMGAKAEVWECFWRTRDDMIIIDPDGEFTSLVTLLGGQVIDVSSASGVVVNPFDINEFYGGEEEPNPIPLKSDFIISMLDVTVGGKDGIDRITRSIVDRCVRQIYQPYVRRPSEKNIPTFQDFFRLLKEQPEPEARYLSSALEIYIEGSLNIFNGRTNVDVQNRLVCFNTRKLNTQLRVMGMTIIQDFVWNRVSRNQAQNAHTWLWNDEVHHSLRNPNTASWLQNSWKRGRKYGLIATGMTQEVRDVTLTEESKTLISNSEFIMLYRQSEDVVDDLSEVIHLSEQQVSHLLHCEEGTGLFKAGNSVVEFDNRFDPNTRFFGLLSTDIGKKAEPGSAFGGGTGDG